MNFGRVAAGLRPLFPVARGLSTGSSLSIGERRALLPSHWPAPLQSHVAGAFMPAQSAELRSVPDAATGSVLVESEDAGDIEVDAAVEAARAAQREWGALSGTERGRVLRRASQILEERNDDLAKLEALDTARPLQETQYVDIASARDCLEWFGCLAPSMMGEHVGLPGGSFAYTRREPLGVTAGIGAWNYPIQGAAWKSAPALACGNAIIFKPAEDTPLTALALAEVYRDAGLPDGLFSVVLGAARTGERLVRHPDIAKVSFTGEVGTGRTICREAAATLKKVTMELGGKSPIVVFEDADLEQAVSAAMLANWYSCGEVCSNGTRVFVQEPLRAAFLERFAERTRKLVVGDPLDLSSHVGALINAAHLDKVMGYVEVGKKEGASLLLGGERLTLPGPCERGAFMSPTIFTDCNDEMTIVKEEIFGPVASVLSFETEEEVVQRANNSEFGLSAGVFTRDIKRAHRMVANLEAGTTWINNYNLSPVELPWGGFKQSGLGRENGIDAVNYWSQVKSVYVEMGEIACPYE